MATHQQNQRPLRLEPLEDRCTPSSVGLDGQLIVPVPLGGGHAQVLLQVSDAVVSRVLPNGIIQIPVDPCLSGLARATLGGDTPVVT